MLTVCNPASFKSVRQTRQIQWKNHPHYIGLTEYTFKDRFYKHKNSFKYESKRNATELSNFVWENKHANTETNLVWAV